MKNKSLAFPVLFLISLILPVLSPAQSWEVVDLQGKLKTRALYERIELLSESVRVGKTDSSLYLLSADLRPMVNLQGTKIHRYLEPWILVEGPLGIGAFHEYGQAALPLEYEEIETYFNILLARKGNSYWIYQKGTGKTIALGQLDHAKITHHGMVITQKNGSYFLPLSADPGRPYLSLQENEGNFLLAKEQSGFGLINREGNYVMDPILDELEHTQGDYFYGRDENQYLLVRGDELQAQVNYNSYHQITKEGDLMLEYIHGKLRRIMEKGGILLDVVGMEQVDLIEKGLYFVRFRDQKTGLIGSKGWLVNPQSDAEWIGKGSEGMFPARKNGKIGFITSNGEWVIEPQFDETLGFAEGTAVVQKNGSWQLISKEGGLLGISNWQEIKPVNKGIAIAKASNEHFLIDRSGNKLTSIGYEKICRLSNGLFITENQGNRGLLDRSGTVLFPTEFESIQPENEDFILVSKEGKSGVISSNGEVIFPLDYLEIIPDWSRNQVLLKSKYEPVILIPEEPTTRKKKKGV